MTSLTLYLVTRDLENLLYHTIGLINLYLPLEPVTYDLMNP